jgi:hypothetical protein
MRTAIYFTLAMLAATAYFTFRLTAYEPLHTRFLRSELILPMSSFSMLVFILGLLTGIFATMCVASVMRERSARLAETRQPRPGT